MENIKHSPYTWRRIIIAIILLCFLKISIQSENISLGFGYSFDDVFLLGRDIFFPKMILSHEYYDSEWKNQTPLLNTLYLIESINEKLLFKISLDYSSYIKNIPCYGWSIQWLGMHQAVVFSLSSEIQYKMFGSQRIGIWLSGSYEMHNVQFFIIGSNDFNECDPASVFRDINSNKTIYGIKIGFDFIVRINKYLSGNIGIKRRWLYFYDELRSFDIPIQGESCDYETFTYTYSISKGWKNYYDRITLGLIFNL